MKPSLLALALLLFLLCPLFSVSLAQDSDAACSSRETVYPRVKTAILDEASYQGVRVRYAAPGERLDIIGSKHFGPWCWLQVSDGWLIDSVRALSSTPGDSATGGGCYRAEKAYIVGSMNIRAGASTQSRALGKAQAGDVLTVTDSRAGADFCWLKTELGWLAKTLRVQATAWRPPVASADEEAASPPASINNCCFVDRHCQSERAWVDGYYAYQRNECPAPGQTQPNLAAAAGGATRIDGSPQFVELVTDALKALRDRAPSWHNFVNSRLARVTDGGGGWLLPEQRTYSAHKYANLLFATREATVIRFATKLVHYACHQWQRDTGLPYDGYSKVQREIECVNMDNAAADALAPHHPAGSFGSVLGLSHCDGDLTNHPRCRWARENCNWDGAQLIDCPAAGLVTVKN